MAARLAARTLLVGLMFGLIGLPVVAAFAHDWCAAQKHDCTVTIASVEDCCCDTITGVRTRPSPVASTFNPMSVPGAPHESPPMSPGLANPAESLLCSTRLLPYAATNPPLRI